jgi:flagellar motor switch protein FliN/FliY
MATARVAPAPSEAPTPESTNHPIEAYLWLRCKTTAEVPVPKFTVGDLLNLRKGSVVQTATRVANDVPIRVNTTLLGWGRFEVVDDRLAVRITELA